METAPRDAHADVMHLYKVAPELLETQSPCALVESLRRLGGERTDRAEDVEPGFDSAL